MKTLCHVKYSFLTLYVLECPQGLWTLSCFVPYLRWMYLTLNGRHKFYR